MYSHDISGELHDLHMIFKCSRIVHQHGTQSHLSSCRQCRGPPTQPIVRPLQVMQIPATTVLVAEKIPSASQFLSRTFAKRIDHHFKDVNDLVGTTLVKCSWHGKKRSGLCPKGMAGCTNRIDLVTAGPPCPA